VRADLADVRAGDVNRRADRQGALSRHSAQLLAPPRRGEASDRL
jgi:hypothetical protein